LSQRRKEEHRNKLRRKFRKTEIDGEHELLDIPHKSEYLKGKQGAEV
jgi:hypothetical protein